MRSRSQILFACGREHKPGGSRISILEEVSRSVIRFPNRKKSRGGLGTAPFSFGSREMKNFSLGERNDRVTGSKAETVEDPTDSAALNEAASYLEGLINLERLPTHSVARLSLRPIQALMERLGNPQQGLSILHVAGSKGKGSTCLFAEAILRSAGKKVGTFTSPHLERWTERFRIDGAEVAPRKLAAAVEKIRPHVEILRQDPLTRPSFFDATTAAAFLLFSETQVDYAVIEVGLGGRLDSTNVLIPRVTCVTSIELEHTDKLGETVEAIAGEKAGILKQGIPCVMGPLVEGAADVVRARARKLDVPLDEYGVDFEIISEEEQSGTRDKVQARGWTYRCADGFTVKGTLGIHARHQMENAALAIACVRRLNEFDDLEVVNFVQQGLTNVPLPGRVEVISRDPWLIVDSAHTAASAVALASALEDFPSGPRHFVISISSDKDPDAILSALLPAASHVTLTRAEPRRSIDLQKLAKLVSSQWKGEVKICEDPVKAIEQARKRLRGSALLCAAGSVYLAGIARTILKDSPERLPPSRRT